MNISKIKYDLESNRGKVLNFRYNGSRNQIEDFSGVIENTYNSIFLIKVEDGSKQIRSFSYTDILTNNLEVFIDKSR